jgi:hypothetical protein
MWFLSKLHLAGRKIAENVICADIDIVSPTVPWPRDDVRESPFSFSSLKAGSYNKSLSPDEEVRGDRRTTYDHPRRCDQSHGRGLPSPRC